MKAAHSSHKKRSALAPFLSLIYVDNTSPARTVRPRWKLGLVVALLFLAVKAPVCFQSSHPEEFRDFDAYRQSAQGLLPFKDYAWNYGPVAPLFFGTVLKVFPQTMLTLRMTGLALWSMAVFFLALLLSRYWKGNVRVIVGALICSGLFGYANYTFNHILATLGMIVSLYYLICHLEQGDELHLFFSWAGLLLCVMTRPVLMGYGLFAAWVAIYTMAVPVLRYKRALAFFVISTALAVGTSFLVIGPAAKVGFVPAPSLILPFTGYPNIHYLFPRRISPYLVESLAKNLRSALETLFFYTHYFVWPTFLFTAGYFFWNRSRSLRAAVITTFFSLAASLDMLHYGFSDPESAQYMTVRGQYFAALTSVSLLLFLWSRSQSSIKKVFAVVFPLLLVVWSYLPWAIGVKRLTEFKVNPYGYRELAGLMFHPDRGATFDAVQFINSLCTEKDLVGITQYDPWASTFIRCKDIFAKDSQMFQRRWNSILVPGESPYQPQGGIEAYTLPLRILSENKLSYLFVSPHSGFLKRCEESGWSYKDFGKGDEARRVCWKR
jgi:hypothetical protein